MVKALVGSGLIIAAAILFVGHYLIAAVLAGGYGNEVPAAYEFGTILSGETVYSSAIFNTSVIVGVVGILFSIWGIIEQRRV
ncbi:hypothetical protein MM326_18200 [Alkalihalobacillus sp. LMS6]|uniref:hypothetical protein n=1 Tax=Alkalihalobacillus sp. LMS6 TaxID=2924034 RepID=UPI0020D0024A|nr:hypothetical protein [Alkalihalobacillus sp. LMS6]UTR05986.1 hypothetical protein MM326_18200 [Alkalihalobacillus sp. LMS6]